MSSSESLSEMLDRWKAGDDAAAQAIYDRYEERIIQYAQRHIGKKARRHLQPESVAILVLESVLRGIEAGRYTVDKSGSIGRLVQKIADNKIRKKWEWLTAQKRDVNKMQSMDESGFPAPPSRESQPDEPGILADRLEWIRARLSPDDFAILELQLEGLSNPEIAKKLGCARQTVLRRIKRIYKLLRHWAQEDADQNQEDADEDGDS